jgi:prephenate dehydrogenase
MNAQASAHDGVRARTIGPVRIVGSGLLGASIGLGLREIGVDVVLTDASPAALSLAIDYGAGRAATPDDAPQLIVVSVPPDVTAQVVADELVAFPDAVVTDVASVKGAVRAQLDALGADVSRYLGSHPMAGRERGGAIMARTDLFVGRPWVLCAEQATQADAQLLVESLALDLGATPVTMTTAEHDESVALVSHLPQVVASLLAARLTGNDDALRLTGQGLRDTSRLAASDPELWAQILSANADPVVAQLELLSNDLTAFIAALRNAEASGMKRQMAQFIAVGNRGVASIPGKHGSADRFSTITAIIDDTPGELARLLTDMGELGINIEDMRLEHSPGAQVGFVELAVLPAVAERASSDLLQRGWRLV